MNKTRMATKEEERFLSKFIQCFIEMKEVNSQLKAELKLIELERLQDDSTCKTRGLVS